MKDVRGVIVKIIGVEFYSHRCSDGHTGTYSRNRATSEM